MLLLFYIDRLITQPFSFHSFVYTLFKCFWHKFLMPIWDWGGGSGAFCIKYEVFTWSFKKLYQMSLLKLAIDFVFKLLVKKS